MFIWKKCGKIYIGYEGLYQISNLGRVKSLPRLRNTKKPYITKEKILKLDNSSRGYSRIELCKNNKKKHFFIHKLVANAFIPNLENKPYINHINR